MGGERLGGGAAVDRLQGRGLNLQVAAAVQERTDPGDHLGPGLEYPPRFGVGDQVQVPAPVAGLNVAQAVEFFRQRPQGLGKQLDLQYPQGRLPGPGQEHLALNSDHVAHVGPGKRGRMGVGPEDLAREQQLQTLTVRIDVSERAAAERRDAGQAAGDATSRQFPLFVPLVNRFAEAVRWRKPVRIRVFNGFELGPPLGDQAIFGAVHSGLAGPLFGRGLPDP